MGSEIRAPLSADALFNVNGLVAVITGGGTGIGLMMAKALAANGAAKVYILSRRADVLEAAAQHHPGVIIPLPGDVTSKDSLAACVERVKEEVGFLNLLVANSGTTGPTLRDLHANPSLDELRKFLWNPPMADFTATYAVNSTAVFYTAVAFLSLLDAGNARGNVTQRSQIIATSSIAGFNRKPTAGFAYGTSKAAVTLLMKQLGAYLVPYNIRANVIAPGIFMSEMAGPLFDMARGEGEEVVFSKEMVPEGRPGREEEIAGTILWLAGKGGGYVNGGVVVVDGGRLSGMPGTF